MMRINSEADTAALNRTTISEQNFLEDDLREWILDASQSILGENVLLIGHEVSIKNIRDGIDLLAIDRDGNVIIIELKKGRITGKTDFQALKYAAYTSHWDYDQLRNQFESFKSTSWGEAIYDDETKFTEALDKFCNDDYSLNQDQRILLVGEGVAERLDIVSRWLSDRDVDITIVEIQLYEDNGRLYLDTERKIPVPHKTGPEVSPDTSEKPWKSDGRSWHLEEVLSDEAADNLEDVVAALEEIEQLDGPDWGQKQYLSFKQDRKNRILARTHRTLFNVEIYDIPAKHVDIDELAESLGVPVEDVRADDEDLRNGRPGVRITCRDGQDIDVDALVEETQQLLEAEGV